MALRPECVFGPMGPVNGPTGGPTGRSDGRDVGLFAPAPTDDAAAGNTRVCFASFFASFDFLSFFGTTGPESADPGNMVGPADAAGFVCPRGAAGPADTVGFGDPGGPAGPAGPTGPAAGSRAWTLKESNDWKLAPPKLAEMAACMVPGRILPCAF
mmetsp:Transcript_124584/g.248577  ORF Transcript_124584/g.248577 Transcript_124584/m.248577 type:complete len:156 (+) Transcript_124584:487-954(+)